MRRPRWLGPYRLLDRIASGGMAETYLAERITPDGAVHQVAIKRLLERFNADEEFIVMLTDEARITGLLDHPNIAGVYEFGLVDEQHFLAMEFVDGADLRATLRRCRERDEPLGPEASAFVVEQALRGLHAAHEAHDAHGRSLELVHRDFSPSNILLSARGEVKLIDFGIAKARLNRARTRAGVIKGKVKYMSPEQTAGKRLGPRSDVFAAGVVLYHAATGHLPFHAPHDAALMVAIREQQPDAPSSHGGGLDRRFDTVLERALAKDPAARYATAADFADALSEWLRARDPDFEGRRVGQMIERIFARERGEARARFDDVDRSLPPDADGTPTHEMQNYTRLVDAGHFTGSGLLDPVADVDQWLARRRVGSTRPPAGDGAVWASDTGRAWDEADEDSTAGGDASDDTGVDLPDATGS